MTACSLREALEDLPDAYPDLRWFRLPGSRPPDPDARTGNTSPARPPLVVDVLDLEDTREKPDAEPARTDFDLDRRAGARRQGVLPTLVSWVRLVDSELWDEGAIHDPPAEQPTVTSECGFLLGNIEWIERQQWASEITEDVTGMLADVRHACGEMPSPKDALICLRSGCGWAVREHAGGGRYTCLGCGQTWGRLELHRMAERKKPKTLKAIAKMLNRSERTLRAYRAERLFRPVARDGSTDLFDIDDVTAVLKVQERDQLGRYRRGA